MGAGLPVASLRKALRIVTTLLPYLLSPYDAAASPTTILGSSLGSSAVGRRLGRGSGGASAASAASASTATADDDDQASIERLHAVLLPTLLMLSSRTDVRSDVMAVLSCVPLTFFRATGGGVGHGDGLGLGLGLGLGPGLGLGVDRPAGKKRADAGIDGIDEDDAAMQREPSPDLEAIAANLVGGLFVSQQASAAAGGGGGSGGAVGAAEAAAAAGGDGGGDNARLRQVLWLGS